MNNTRVKLWLGRWRQRSRRWATRIRQREEELFPVLTLILGALVGVTVVAFVLLTERVGAQLYPPDSAAWRRVLIPVGGALAMGLLLARYFPDARGSGVPQTRAALFVREGRITLRTVLGKFFCTSATLAAGIPLGREGPAVQVGSGIASVLGRWLGLSRERIKALLPVGSAAAIAAAFNTPLAGVLFALEEIMGDLSAPMLGSVVLGAATSWMGLRLLLGNEPLFRVPEYQLVHPLELIIYVILGVAGGLLSVVFVKSLLRMREGFLGMPKRTEWFQPVAGGLGVGLLGLVVPQVLGVGYGYVGDALNGNMTLQIMALLAVLKLVTVALSYASGNAGGIFGPSLFIGAMLGGTLGSVAHYFFPESTAEPGAYALVGMGTAFAGIVRAPLTSVVMIFELTRDYAIIVPLMISNLLSFLISRWLQPRPVYDALALQDGIHLPTAETRARAGRLRVSLVARTSKEMLPEEITVAEALERTRQGARRGWLVGTAERVEGVLSVTQLERGMRERDAAVRVVELLDRTRLPHVHPDHPLELALERMGASGLDVLPVVSRADMHELLGEVLLADILRAYGIGGSRGP